jgi:hypothetical protein
VRSSELTGRALGNSRTAVRAAEKTDADGLAADLITSAIGHTPSFGLLRQIVSAVPSKIKGAMQSRSNTEIAGMLTTPGSPKLDQILSSVRDQPRLRGPVADYESARKGYEISPTTRNLARLTISSRNLSNNLRDIGIQIPPDRLIGRVGSVRASEEGEQ